MIKQNRKKSNQNSKWKKKHSELSINICKNAQEDQFVLSAYDSSNCGH